MTKQDAIHQLEMVAEVCTTTPLAEAALMGARALEQSEADGCDGCRWTGKRQWEQPCIDCRNGHVNRWESDEHDRTD